MKLSPIGCALLAWTSLAHAADLNPGAICPATLDTSQQATAPSGYQVRVGPGANRLKQIQFSDGVPGDQGTMEPSDTAGEDGGVTTIKTWRFRITEKRPVYVICTYNNTTVELIRPLAQNVKKCMVTYNSEIQVGDVPRIVSSSCI